MSATSKVINPTGQFPRATEGVTNIYNGDIIVNVGAKVGRSLYKVYDDMTIIQTSGSLDYEDSVLNDRLLALD